jgi:hypothetical protein
MSISNRKTAGEAGTAGRIEGVVLLGVLLVMILLTGPSAYAEDISNYNGCDVCPGTIHYGVFEAKILIGLKGPALAARLKKAERKEIKVDLDGSLPYGSKKDSAGYELKVLVLENAIYIIDLRDGSYIYFVTDSVNIGLGNWYTNWSPEIFLQAGDEDKIRLDDSVKVAWDKMRKSSIYGWVTSNDAEADWTESLREKLIWVLKLAAEQRRDA